MTVIGLIPARGGSKGILKKSIAQCAGRTLLSYTADAAIQSNCLDRIVLSTDDEAIAEEGRRLGLEVPFLRPKEIALDTTPMLQVMSHLITWLLEQKVEVKALVLMQPTSPMRRSRHIDEAFKIFMETDAGSVVSVCEVPHQYNPVSVLNLENGVLTPYLPNSPLITRRQDKPKLFGRNGPAIVISRPESILRGEIYQQPIRGYIMDAVSSVDIDGPEDLAYADYLLRRQVNL